MRRVRKILSVFAITICGLVVVLQLPAAAKTAKTVISGSDIKSHSISGSKLKNNTLTGKQIKESTLGVVPKAKSLPALVWHPLTLENGWENSNLATDSVPAYAVDAQGIVHLRGAIEGGTDNGVAFTLPTSLDPTYGISVTAIEYDAYTGYLGVETNGDVYVVDSPEGPSGPLYTSLDGIT
jgi:hypothetical protein